MLTLTDHLARRDDIDAALAASRLRGWLMRQRVVGLAVRRCRATKLLTRAATANRFSVATGSRYRSASRTHLGNRSIHPRHVAGAGAPASHAASSAEITASADHVPSSTAMQFAAQDFMMLSAPAARPLTVQKLNVLRRFAVLFMRRRRRPLYLKYLISLPITDWYVACGLNIRRRTDPRAGQGRERQKSTTVR